MKRKILALIASFVFTGIIILTFIFIKLKNSKIQQLKSYNPQTVELSYGKMTYADKGQGQVILSVHGIFGGYDQAFDTCKEFASDYRIVAPSRFGYLNSDVMQDGTPALQAKAYMELLDKLGIEKVFLLATSAGGTVAIRMALDFPERVSGLILYCSAMPHSSKPEKFADYAGPPPFMCNDVAMFLLSPLFKPIMGMEPSTIKDMFPISQRKTGVVIDAAKTNPDMARNFDEYKIEELKMPVLIVHAKDDKLASYKDVEKAVSRFPDVTLVAFEKGGHLLEGHGQEVEKAVKDFVNMAK